MVLASASAILHFLAQQDFSNFEFPGGTRGFTGLAMIVHMFFAELFVGFAVAAPVLELWGARKGSPRMDRLAHSITRFNVLTFSTGATFAVLFLVLLVGFYPRVTTALFTHFFYVLVIAVISILLALWAIYTYYYKWDRYSVLNKGRHLAIGFAAGMFIWIWMVILTGIDTYMVTGGGPNVTQITEGNITSFGSALSGIFNPMFIGLALHRTFANLSWPAFAVAAWGAFMYARVKKPEDKAFFDWSTSIGLMWGVGFLLVQPIAGFAIAYSMKLAEPQNPVDPNLQGSYTRLTEGATSHLLYVNLAMVVGLFVLSNAAMYLKAGSQPERGTRRPIQFFGLVAAVAGLYSISPIAEFPFLYMRYIMLLIMVLATVGALATYVRSQARFRYGDLARSSRVALLALGILAAVVALSMGFMKSNSRLPYTVYNQPDFTVQNERPPSGFGR